MYSRYHHIMTDEKHWQHSVLKNLDIDRGFLKSCTHVNSIEKNYFNTHVPPLKYYLDWLSNWEKNLHEDDLKVTFEEFLKNKSDFICKILDFLNINENNLRDKILTIINNEDNKSIFKKNVKKFGRNMSTLRIGMNMGYKKTLTVSTQNEFYKLVESFK